MKLGGAVGSLDGTEIGADLGEQADTVATAFAAISERRTLSFEYRERDRRVRPYGLVHRRGRWYLVAAELGADEIKVYRLDRADGLTTGDQPGAFATPEGFDPAGAVLDRPWDAGRDTTSAAVVFDEGVAWIAERELGSNAKIERRPDGSIMANVEIAALAAFLGWLIGFEDHAEIVEPQDFRDRYLALVGGS